jgi:hypothetical protein
MVVVCWECMAGAQVVHILDPLAEQAWSASGLWASLPGPQKLLCPFLLTQNQTQVGMGWAT